MALSKEFYLDEIRSKYPNSYNESLKDLPVKDLEDMLDFLDQALDKADGGSIGIEVLFGPKRDEFSIGGNVQRATTPQPYDPRASVADFARAIDKVGGGTDLQKAIDIDRYGKNIQRQNMLNRIQKMNPAGTGNFLQGIKDFGDHARVSQAMKGKVTGPGLKPGEVIPEYAMQSGYDFQKKFTGLDPKISAGLAAAYQTLQEGSRALNPFGDTFLRFPTAMKTAQEQATKNIEGILAAESNNLTAEQQANRNKFLASQGQPTETMTAATPTPKEGYITLQEFEDYQRNKAYDFMQSPGNRNRPKEEIEANIKSLVAEAGKDPDNYLRNYMGNFDSIIANRLKDGGRVGLFMGGPPLEGQALSIYNSMSAYGFSDQEIADALVERGLYTPGGTTQPEQVTEIINQQIQTGGGGDGGSNVPRGSRFATLEKTYDPTKNYGEFFSGVKGTPSMVSNYQTPPTFLEGLLSIPGNLVKGYIDISSKLNPITRFIKDRAEKQQTLQDNAIEKARKEREMQQAIKDAEAAQAALDNAVRTGRRPGSGSGPTTKDDGGGSAGTGGYSYDAGGREGFGYGLRDGGLATMFTRRR